MDTLILGGTRNLGPVLVSALLEDGHRVTVFHRGVTHADLPGDVVRLRGDRSDPASVRRAIAGRSFDLVVDTTLYNGPDAEAIAAILDGRVGRYVFLSSGQVYLVRTGVPTPFVEEAYDGPVVPPPPEGTRDHDEWRYGVEKRDAEDALERAWRRSRFPFTTLRLPMVNSERDHYHRVQGYVLRLRDGGPILVPSGPHRMLRHVYGDDVARIVAALAKADAGKGRAYNICQDETCTLEEFLTLLAERVGCALRLRHVDRAALDRSGLIPDCSPFSDPWMSESDNRRSKAELGATYTPLAEYVTRLVDHYTHTRLPIPEGYRRRGEELRLAEDGREPRG